MMESRYAHSEIKCTRCGKLALEEELGPESCRCDDASPEKLNNAMKIIADKRGFYLHDCQAMILGEISNAKMRRLDVAKTYALAMRSRELIDWPIVNAAIIKRWSPSALDWIKTKVWSGKCFPS